MSEEENINYLVALDHLFEWRNTLAIRDEPQAWNAQDQKTFQDIVKIIDNARQYKPNIQKE